MAFSSGTFSRLYNFVTLVAGGTKVDATRMDAELDGMATGLSSCILKDGTQTVTANIPMNSKKFTGLAAGSASGDSARYEQMGSTLLASGTLSDDATLDLVLTGYTTFRLLKFVFTEWIPATDEVGLQFFFSTDGGSTFITTSNYSYSYSRSASASSISTTGTTGVGAGNIVLSGSGTGIGNGSSEGYSGEITLYKPSSTAAQPRLTHSGFFINASGTPVNTWGGASHSTVQDVDAIRFSFTSGNITSGAYSILGIR